MLWYLISWPFFRESQAILFTQNGSCDISWRTEMMYRTRHKCQDLTTWQVKAWFPLLWCTGRFPLLWFTGMFPHGSTIMVTPELDQVALIRIALWAGYESSLRLAPELLLHHSVNAGTKPYCVPLFTGLMRSIRAGRGPRHPESGFWEGSFCTGEALAVSFLLKLPPLLQFCSHFPTSSVQ